MGNIIVPKRSKKFSIDKDSSLDELTFYIISISVPTTPSVLMRMVAELPSCENTQKMGTVAIYVAMGQKKKAISFFKEQRVSFPNEHWMINNKGMHFTRFGMLGHIIFMLGESNLTGEAREMMNQYRKSIGEGTFSRNDALRDMKKRFVSDTDFNAKDHQAELARCFPHFVLEKKYFPDKKFMMCGLIILLSYLIMKVG